MYSMFVIVVLPITNKIKPKLYNLTKYSVSPKNISLLNIFSLGTNTTSQLMFLPKLLFLDYTNSLKIKKYFKTKIKIFIELFPIINIFCKRTYFRSKNLKKTILKILWHHTWIRGNNKSKGFSSIIHI